jgi:hypothetical protein
LVLVATIVWLAPARAGRQDAHRHGDLRRGNDLVRGSLIEAAVELRRHADLLERAGLSEVQVERIAGIIDRSTPALEEFSTARDVLAGRAADALGGDTIDAEALASLEEEAARLAADVIHESFDLVMAVTAELTPEQRAQLIRKWRERQ